MAAFGIPTSLFRNRRFMLDEKIQRNVTKLDIPIFRIWKPMSIFFSFLATCFIFCLYWHRIDHTHRFFVFQKHDKFWSISSSIILLFLKYYIWVTIFWCFSLNEKLRKPFKSPTYFSCDEKQCVYHFSAQWHLGFQMQTWIYKPFPPYFFFWKLVLWQKGNWKK